MRVNIFSDNIIDLTHQEKLFLSLKNKFLILFIFIVFVISWQSLFILNRGVASADYGRKDASGFSHNFAKHFTYFYYYLGLFPVATTYQPLNYSLEGAKNNLEQHGDSLLMEWGHWSRLGENTRIMLYLPDAWINGSPENPSI